MKSPLPDTTVQGLWNNRRSSMPYLCFHLRPAAQAGRIDLQTRRKLPQNFIFCSSLSRLIFQADKVWSFRQELGGR